MIFRTFFEGIITDYEFHVFVYKLVGSILTTIATVATILAIAIAFVDRNTLRKSQACFDIIVPFLNLVGIGCSKCSNSMFLY